MQLGAGSKLGVYEIASPLGAGGMGEVYRGRDTKLGRDVALKVLPSSFVEDPERLARFQREAQILASLNHPNIAAIYGLEQQDETRFLVLELVEGETLDQRIGHGSWLMADGTRSLPLDEVLAIARQVADALEAAHKKGIVHRDLKPANILVTDDGVVKVLDFGLAKTLERGAAGDQSQSPTITFAATQAGVILGTAAYMSPEQAKGRTADKRTDVWAFGCVLFEMLTGRRAFEGDDITETIAAIVRGEPDWNALPAGVPDQIRLLIRRCLDKDRRTRVGDIAVARFLMSEPVAAGSSATAAPAPLPRPRSSRLGVVAAIGGLLAGAALTAGGMWAFSRRPVPAPRLTARFSIVAPQSQPLILQGADRSIDMAPDGSFIVYRGSAQGVAQLFVRALNDTEPRALSGATDARSPFISPDGQWVGYFQGQQLKKISISGGQPITVCTAPGIARGAVWGPDGTILFGTSNASSGIMAVAATGGEPKTLIKPEGRTIPYGFPSVAGDGTTVLFTIGMLGASPETVINSEIVALNRKTGEVKPIVRGGSQAQFVDGFLFFAGAGTIRAVRFDLDRLAVLGEPIPIVERVQMTPQGSANFAISTSGSLVYVPASAGVLGATSRSLLWVTRDGREDALKVPPRPYEGIRLSPDGTRFAAAVFDEQNDIWIGDVSRGNLTRLTFDPSLDQAPVWTPDGKYVIWSSQRSMGTPNLFRQAADGTGAFQQLTASPYPTFPTSITPDGSRIVGWENNPATKQDIMSLDAAVPSTPARTVESLIRTPAVEVDAEVSPDGRWLAYESDDSGHADVYVRPFPNVDAGKWQISTTGGTRPAWARSGRELFYLDAEGLLTSVSLDATGRTLSVGNPARILSTKYYPGFTGLGLDLRAYDVAPDGRRFLMAKAAQVDRNTTAPAPSMFVVLNWIEEVKARIPAK